MSRFTVRVVIEVDEDAYDMPLDADGIFTELKRDVSELLNEHEAIYVRSVKVGRD